MVDSTPLPYWVTATNRSMKAMQATLPPELYDMVDAALIRIQAQFFETSDKIPYALAEEWVSKAVATAEPLRSEFMFQQR